VRRTKILATVGPSSSDPAKLAQMMRAGMDAARINFSHGAHEDQARLLKAVREAADEVRKGVPVVQDLAGTKMRIGSLAEGRVHLSRGSELHIDTEKAPGDSKRFGIDEPRLIEASKPGQQILLGDGEVSLEVTETHDDRLRAVVVQGGLVRAGAGITAPGASVPGGLTKKDKADLEFGARHGLEYVALSFVRNAEEVTEARQMLDGLGHDAPLIVKIERLEALANLKSIMGVADAVLVARGDLGLALPPEEVPVWQKRILSACVQAGRLSITATQMLESMVTSMRPTRAETSDVANAIFDGSHAVMLSAETAVGQYPVTAVAMMDRIARSTETALLDGSLTITQQRGRSEGHVSDAISLACVVTAEDLNARLIVAFTQSGTTALRVAKHKPRVPILAATPDPVVERRLALLWGVVPAHIKQADTLDEMIHNAEAAARERQLVESGDLIVLTGGDIGVSGSTNLMRVTEVR
jgi:pyruvate kinase